MKSTWVCMALWTVCGMALSEAPGPIGSRAGFVVPLVVEGSILNGLDLDRGEWVYVEVEYRVRPDGEPVFVEPAEQIWWVQDQGLLLLGSTGLPLPTDVCRRGQAFVQAFFDGEPLWLECQRILPQRDGFFVPSDANSLAQKLQSRLVGVDASYLSQVANYLAANVTSLDVRGETLTIDSDGWFGGTLETGGLRMAVGAADGRVLSCDAHGDASWIEASSGGFSLPYSGSASNSGPLFLLEQMGLGDTMQLVSSNASSYSPCLRLESNNAGPCVYAENTFLSSAAMNNGNAGWFRTTNTDSQGAALYAESLSNVGGPALAAIHQGENGTAAWISNFSANNTETALTVSTGGTGTALEAINLNPTSGTAATFRMGNTANASNVIEADTGGSGIVFNGQNNGTGTVAKLTIANSASTAKALDVNTHGVGMAGYFEGDNASSQAAVLKSVSKHSGAALHVVNESYSSNADLGAAGIFECTDPSPFGLNAAILARNGGSGDCVRAESTGPGVPGRFVNNNATSGNTALFAINNSTSYCTLRVFNNSATGPAGDFGGDVAVNGTLSKTAGSFRIDHPLDPEHKYLQHSFVESPDMMNIYNGMVTLDSQGEAWVQLPDWFEALNRSFRYQLTAMGQPGPNLHIAREIDRLQFQIAGGGPGQKVCWQVTGIRQDPYAQHHPIQTEVDKPSDLVGKYVFPEGYGANKASSISSPDHRFLPDR